MSVFGMLFEQLLRVVRLALVEGLGMWRWLNDPVFPDLENDL